MITLKKNQLLLRRALAMVTVTWFLLGLSNCKPEIDCDTEPTIETSAILDQYTSLTPNPPFSYNNEILAPLGQRFVPTLHALDFVSIYIGDASCSASGGPGGDLLVRIRKSSMTGNIVGVSNTVHFDNCFVGVKEFQFAPYVPVSPGQPYFIEVVYVSGNGAVVFVSLNSAAYGPGSFYLSGVEKTDADLVFQEGIFHSLPKSKCDCKARLPFLLSPSGLPFKNQGQCIKFVNHQE